MVRIIQPTGGIQARVPFSISVKAEASDNLALKSITLALSQNGLRFTAPLVIPTQGKQTSIDTTYVVTDRYLEGGSYSLTVTADDGIQTTSDFSPIQISPYPDSTLGYWVALSSNSDHQLILLDTSFQVKNSWLLSDVPVGMAYQYRNDNLWLAFKNRNLIRGIRLDGGLNWEVASGLQPISQFHPWAGVFNNEFYTCDRNGFVRSRDAFGQILWAWSIPETQSIPYFLYRDQTRLFVGIQPNGNGEPRFKIIHALFSGQLLERTIQMNLTNIQKQDADRYWLLGWQGNDGKIARYQYTTNSWSVAKSLPGEKIISAITQGNNEVLLATTLGLRKWLTLNETLTLPIPPAGIKQFVPLANHSTIMFGDQSIYGINGPILWNAPIGYKIEAVCEYRNK